MTVWLLSIRQISPEDFTKLKDFIHHNSTQIIDKINEAYFFAEKEVKVGSDQLFAYMR